MAEAGGLEEGIQPVDQPLVAAPVGRQRVATVGDGRCLQVGVHVGPPEGVDGLLGVADEDEGGAAPGERPADDVPLDEVGVLELVDDHDVEPARERPADVVTPGPIVDGLGQLHQQLIEGQQARLPQPLVHLPLDAFSEAAPPPGRLVAGRWLELGGRVGDRLGSDGTGHAEVEARRPVTYHPAGIDVADRLGHDRIGILAQRPAFAHGGQHPQAGEGQLAEAVGRGDGGGVEGGQSVGQRLAPPPHLIAAALGHGGHHGVVPDGALPAEDPSERLFVGYQALADPVSQFGSRHAGEGHRQDAGNRSARSDEPGHEGSQGERLPRARAGFEQGHTGVGQRPAQVERRRARWRAHTCSIVSWLRRGSQSRRASRPRRVVSSLAHPGPSSPGAGGSARRALNGTWPP